VLNLLDFMFLRQQSLETLGLALAITHYLNTRADSARVAQMTRLLCARWYLHEFQQQMVDINSTQRCPIVPGHSNCADVLIILR
jgi:hypothetical protein